ncbi:MAG TPA: hypothetical protein VL240_11360 [Candidatus Binatia bacterium]|nr:hypothetical protein [Candidatus Binatia bacterium]
MMRSAVVALISLIVAVPAFGKTHNDTYSVPCSQLWDAVQETVKNSGYYTPVVLDNAQMTSAFNISGAIHSRTISVRLEPKGTNCEMQTQTSFSGVFQNDAGDFKSRVDHALAKLKASQPSEPARP